MPLTKLQREILALLATSRTPDSYLARGAAIHFSPESLRFSSDLDFFHDSVERVASAFSADQHTLITNGYVVEVEISQPGFVRALVQRATEATRIDWAQHSAWRFMPTIQDSLGGYLLHRVDLAINKVLALAGRDEPRDFVDILYIHQHVLPLAGLVWAAAGKDPGFTPLSLLDLLKRRGRHHPEDIARLNLAEPFDVVAAKQQWLAALADCDAFIRSRPETEVGCLYYSVQTHTFVVPEGTGPLANIVPHFGRPGGVMPQPAGQWIAPITDDRLS